MLFGQFKNHLWEKSSSTTLFDPRKKRMKRVLKRVNLDFFKNCLKISKFKFSPFDKNPCLPLFGTLFLAGVRNYYISAISPINISEIGQKAKKLWEVKILTYKKRQILYINCSRKTFVRDIYYITLIK